MKLRSLTLAVLLAMAPFASAQSPLHFAGVLGNSGEQGATLVRMGPANRGTGGGVVVDRFGTLWSRGGEGLLNHYAVDGRLLAGFQLPKLKSNQDQISLVGDTLVLRVGQKLLTLPIMADAKTAFTPLKNVNAAQISAGSYQGQLAVATDAELLMLNPASGETRTVAKLPDTVRGVEFLPEGNIAVIGDGKIRLVRSADGQDVPQDKPLPSPGERAQFLDRYWFGGAWHGTLRRFNASGEPDPGVVLGGGSGSFIGHLEESPDVENPRGVAKVRDGLLAISGIPATVQLLAWRPGEQRYDIVRRIGCIAHGRALGLDLDGHVWWWAGNWNWSDGPDAPLRNGMAPPDPTAMAPVTTVDGRVFIAPALRNQKLQFMHGTADQGLDATTVDIADATSLIKATAATVATPDAKLVLLLDKAGSGRAVRIGRDGRPGGDGGEAALKAKEPIKGLTSLAATSRALIAGADGAVIEFTGGGTDWTESQRWSKWGDNAADHFGPHIDVAAEGSHLWVADADRHRVLVFDASAGAAKLLAVYGTADQPGDTVAAFNAPTTIAAAGGRAVVYDSGNQRLLKLELPR